MTRPLIGLVSGTYNRLVMLQRMVETFRANIPVGITHTITLIDGGSTDGTLEWARQQPDVKLIEDGQLKGAISAFTRGALATDADYIIMANDDVEFAAGSIMRALVHLEENPRCGGVAFKDNRPIPDYYDETMFKVLRMPAMVGGKPDTVIYAQVGMFRKWLGDLVDWWGAHTTMKDARTYGGDNNLSAHIWAHGYSIDQVDGCMVIDRVAEDELRQINRAQGKIAAVHDSEMYYRQWAGAVKGPVVPPAPTAQPPDLPHVRILYLPIYEPGWAVQKVQKRGLRDALSRAKTPKGWGVAVWEVDYLAIPEKDLEAELLRIAGIFQPRIILTQIQAPRPITPALLSKLRAHHPRASIINWNGDYWPNGLTSPEMLQLLRQVDLQLTINGSVLDTYKQHGIAAAYWQIGYEEPGNTLPEMPAHDVVWLANAYGESRKRLGAALREKLGDYVGLYGSGWDNGLPNTLYNFAAGKAIYNRAKIAIGTNEYPDAYGFVSNRLFQAMAAGGALYLQQHVPGLKELTGLLPGTHFIEWKDEDDLHQQIAYWLHPANEADRKRIAEAGTRFVREYHSFDARVMELFGLIKQHFKPARDPDANAVWLRYKGKMQEQFGVPSRTHERVHYLYEPGKPLLVDTLDAPYFLAQHELWELAE